MRPSRVVAWPSTSELKACQNDGIQAWLLEQRMSPSRSRHTRTGRTFTGPRQASFPSSVSVAERKAESTASSNRSDQKRAASWCGAILSGVRPCRDGELLNCETSRGLLHEVAYCMSSQTWTTVTHGEMRVRT